MDLNIIPLLNVFVIIIPFLLLTAVFARTAIIDILLPGESGAAASTSPAEEGRFLTVKVTGKGFRLGGIGRGRFIPKKNGRLDFEALTDRLVKLKDRYPQVEEVAILFDPDVSYDLVIKVMDSAREAYTVKDGKRIRRILFPVVSLGENR